MATVSHTFKTLKNANLNSFMLGTVVLNDSISQPYGMNQKEAKKSLKAYMTDKTLSS
jgi:hypothetical protein